MTSSAPVAWQLSLALSKPKGIPLTVYSLFGPPILTVIEGDGFVVVVVGATATVVVGETEPVVVG